MMLARVGEQTAARRVAVGGIASLVSLAGRYSASRETCSQKADIRPAHVVYQDEHEIRPLRGPVRWSRRQPVKPTMANMSAQAHGFSYCDIQIERVFAVLRLGSKMEPTVTQRSPRRQRRSRSPASRIGHRAG